MPQVGHWSGLSRRSNRWRAWQETHSTRGSLNWLTCPEASQTWGAWMIAESSPTTSSRSCTIERHQAAFTLRSRATPRGP